MLGGDHLGPNPWAALGVRLAMTRAAEMVRDYVRAGYAKVHLDASMRCADDPLGPLADTVAAARTADLAVAAEAAAAERAPDVPAPVYVIGTEVPPPGGQSGGHEGPAVTPRRGRRAGPRPRRARPSRAGGSIGPGGE